MGVKDQSDKRPPSTNKAPRVPDDDPLLVPPLPFPLFLLLLFLLQLLLLDFPPPLALLLPPAAMADVPAASDEVACESVINGIGL